MSGSYKSSYAASESSKLITKAFPLVKAATILSCNPLKALSRI